MLLKLKKKISIHSFHDKFHFFINKIPNYLFHFMLIEL